MKSLKNIDWKKFDIVSVTAMVILLCIGIYCIKQADIMSGDLQGLYRKQVIGVALGGFLMIVILLVDYRFICKFSLVFYLGILGVLAYTLKYGDKFNNVRRWVTIAGIQLQPSELAKTVLIIFLAFLCNCLRKKMDKFYTLLILGVVVAIPVLLILMQPHMSTSLVILIVFCVIVYMSGLSYKIIGSACLLAAAVLGSIFVVVGVYKVDLPLIKPYQVNRILSFLSSDEGEDQSGMYQQNQAVLAIANGGKNGKFVEGDSSVRAFSPIYANESDFIFSVVGEEFGFIGCTIIIVLYFILVVRCLIIGAHAPDYMGKLICVGVSAMLMFQVFINIGVATSLLPNTGLPLPFISYGLTSLINSMAAVAMVLNVGLRRTRSIERDYEIFS